MTVGEFAPGMRYCITRKGNKKEYYKVVKVTSRYLVSHDDAEEKYPPENRMVHSLCDVNLAFHELHGTLEILSGGSSAEAAAKHFDILEEKTPVVKMAA